MGVEFTNTGGQDKGLQALAVFLQCCKCWLAEEGVRRTLCRYRFRCGPAGQVLYGMSVSPT